jgi:acylphosphatase
VFLNGRPSGTPPYAPLVAGVVQRGLAYATLARPGYAGSTRLSGRSVDRRRAAEESGGGGGANPIQVITAIATARNINVDLEAIGTANSNESVTITSRTSNIVTAIHFNDGQFVKAGQVLVRIQGIDAGLRLDEARAPTARAEANVKMAESQNSLAQTTSHLYAALLATGDVSKTVADQARRCFVAGRVQGVFYRASARQRATDLGVTAVARNLADGRVEVLACGPRAAVESFGAWLGLGPPAASVSSVLTPPRHLTSRPISPRCRSTGLTPSSYRKLRTRPM